MASTPPLPSRGPAHAPTGEILADRYRLERRIGQGGMAEVWVATDTGLDRKVAVKLLKTNLATDPIVAERFRREAIAVARLNHPNIVGIHDVIEHEGRQAVVMQLVDGKSLRQLLDGQKRLGPELTIHVGAAIAGALDEAHRAGFVHRDVKPGNILVTSDGRVLLTDFGIAKGLQPGDDDLTSDNVMMGTAKYLSPEQVRGKRLDGRADLYSLALVLYECLAGRVPFLGETDADTALARLQRDPTDLGHLRPTLPIGLVNLIHKTLGRNPAHRPQTGADLRAALLAVDTSPPHIDGTPADPPPRIANPPTQALGAGPGVPGDPHISGVVPVTRRDSNVAPRYRDDRPVRRGETLRSGTTGRAEHAVPDPRAPGPDDVTPPSHESRDDTPRAMRKVHGTPARQDQQRWTPSLVMVSALLVVALVVAVVLFVTINQGDQANDLTDDTVLPQDDTIGADAGDPTQDGQAAAQDDADGAGDGADVGAGVDVPIATLQAWDPDGDNGTENDAQVGLVVADGSSSTAWATECYSDRYLGGKRGVGIIVGLYEPTAGTLSIESLNAPYAIDVYATTSPGAPATLEAWTKMGESAYDETPGTIEFPVDIAATHLLVWVTELGTDEVCSSANPYRGRLGELSYRSS